MKYILNLTQHASTPEQRRAGVRDLPDTVPLSELLTFPSLPTPGQVRETARFLASLAAETGLSTAMIGGAPFLMEPLAQELRKLGIEPVFAFSKRVSVETLNSDGSTSKTSVFRHLGFVQAYGL